MKPRGQLTERACPVGSIKQEVKSPVQMRFLEIQSVQEEMGALIAELEQRMDPCLCPDAPANDTGPAKPPPTVATCDLGNRLVQIWERMQEVARTISVILPPGTGFVVLAFDFGAGLRQFEYVSNGQREQVIEALKAFIDKARDPERWGKVEP